jgi:hypothetical protein
LAILRVLAALAIFQVLAVVIVIAAEMVPDRMVADALVEGIDRGWISTTHHPTTGLDNRVDRWTECTALTMGLGDPPESNNVETAITNPQLGKCELSVPALLAYREGEILEPLFHYYRYWHGYTIVSRPGLALLGVAGTRMLSLALAAAAIVATTVAVARSTSILAALLLIAPAFLTSDLVDLAESVPHALAAAACWGAALFAWTSVQRKQTLETIAVVGVLTGAVAAFVDLMVFIPGTLTLISILMVVGTWMHGWRGRKLFGAGVVASLTWFLGFAMTWAAKWMVAGVVVGFGEVVDNVREQVAFRITGEHASVVDAFGQATTMNVEYWFDRPLGFLIPVALIAVIFLALRGWRREILQPSYLVLLFGLTMAPFVWYEALSSHSQIHHWITYKSLPLALGALLFALAVGNADNRKRFRPQSMAAGAPELDLTPLDDPGGAPRP